MRSMEPLLQEHGTYVSVSINEIEFLHIFHL
jgi:hypothetical protein